MKISLNKINRKHFLFIILLMTVIIITSIFAVRFIKSNSTQKQIEKYQNQKIETYGKLNIISDAVIIEGEKNTIAGIKEAVRLGADTITLDLCFDSKDVPVICDDYNKISDDVLKLEDVFKLLNEKKYYDVKLNLRLQQLGSIKKFNDLFDKYKMDGRVILSGFDKKRYNMLDLSSTSAEVFFNCVPEKNVEKAADYIFSLYDDYGISGVIISCENITPELVEKLYQHGKTFIISDADDELSMYEAINSGANLIETSSPEKLTEIYNSWKNHTKDIIEKSIIDGLK